MKHDRASPEFGRCKFDNKHLFFLNESPRTFNTVSFGFSGNEKITLNINGKDLVLLRRRSELHVEKLVVGIR